MGWLFNHRKAVGLIELFSSLALGIYLGPVAINVCHVLCLWMPIGTSGPYSKSQTSALLSLAIISLASAWELGGGGNSPTGQMVHASLKPCFEGGSEAWALSWLSVHTRILGYNQGRNTRGGKSIPGVTSLMSIQPRHQQCRSVFWTSSFVSFFHCINVAS